MPIHMRRWTALQVAAMSSPPISALVPYTTTLSALLLTPMQISPGSYDTSYTLLSGDTLLPTSQNSSQPL